MKQTDATLKAWLARAIATGGPYDPAALFLGVATAIVDHGRDTVMADVTEATGDMATRQAVTPWGAIHKLTDGRWCADGPALTFAPADATEAQTLSHYFLASLIAAGVLKAWQAFSPAQDLPSGDYSVTIVVRVTIDQEGRFDANVIING